MSIIPFYVTYPKCAFSILLFALQASMILMRPSSPRYTSLKLIFFIGFKVFFISAFPIYMPALSLRPLFFERTSLVIFSAPSLSRASYK